MGEALGRLLRSGEVGRLRGRASPASGMLSCSACRCLASLLNKTVWKSEVQQQTGRLGCRACVGGREGQLPEGLVFPEEGTLQCFS